ncbi:MAG: hypothetical protein Q8R36_00460 [bacterium]|nr:hypothetical protein [bacterium]
MAKSPTLTLYCQLLTVTDIDPNDRRNMKTAGFYMHVVLDGLDLLSMIFEHAGASYLGRFIKRGEGREEVILAWEKMPSQQINYDRELHLSFDSHGGYKLQEGSHRRFFPFQKGPGFVQELMAFLEISN